MIPIIDGDTAFAKKTKKALAIIEKSPEKYSIVLKYVRTIKQSNQTEQSGMHCPSRTFLVTMDTYSSSKYWYASSIVHDAYHSKLYHDYLENNNDGDNMVQGVWFSDGSMHIYNGETAESIYMNSEGYVCNVPLNIYRGETAESMCLNFQVSFLEEISKNKWFWKWHIKSLMKSRWWEKSVP